MEDISGFGLTVIVRASVTYPSGVTVSQFADDSDPFDIPAIVLAESAMGLNGDLVTWSKANPLAVTIGIIPNSEDDLNLQVLAENNRVGKGKRSVRDIITVSAVYPDGRVLNFSKGKVTSAIIGNAVASAGRMKSKPYIFTFENMTRN